MSAFGEAAFRGEIAIGELVREALDAHSRANRIALHASGESVSYAQLARRVDMAAQGLLGSRFAKLPIAIPGHRDPDTVAVVLAALLVGQPAMIFDPRTSPEIVARQFERLGIYERPVTMGSLELRDARSFPPISAADDAFIQMTSGSTGEVKAALLTQGNLACNAAGIVQATGISPDDRLLHVMPLHHTNGINNQIIAPFLAGATVFLEPRFRANEALRAIREDAITILTGVPTIYARMLAEAGPKTSPHLRFLRCGSAPLDIGLHLRIEEAFQVPLVVSYGLSEATCTSTLNVPHDRRLGSVGKALRGQEVAIFEPGGTRRKPEGEQGEIRIAGAAVMRRYLGSDEQPVRDGWLHTGDLGHIDAEGHLFITGRSKEIIIRGGENISPREIEEAVMRLPGVASCCAVGVPDPDLGEVPVLFVVRAAGSTLDPDEVADHIRKCLSPAHIPGRVIEVPDLPTNFVGKIDRRQLALRAGQLHATG